MTEVEARTVMKAHGWSYKERAIYEHSPKYIYAKQRQGLKVIEQYICPLSRLGELTEAELVTKLTQSPSARKP
jgi:hypothetical protein